MSRNFYITSKLINIIFRWVRVIHLYSIVSQKTAVLSSWDQKLPIPPFFSWIIICSLSHETSEFSKITVTNPGAEAEASSIDHKFTTKITSITSNVSSVSKIFDYLWKPFNDYYFLFWTCCINFLIQQEVYKNTIISRIRKFIPEKFYLLSKQLLYSLIKDDEKH